jgi:hypothetical protein
MLVQIIAPSVVLLLLLLLFPAQNFGGSPKDNANPAC